MSTKVLKYTAGVVNIAKPLRADALRNWDRIVRAARDAWIEEGPDASLDSIARRAGLGIATLYRHFPDKSELARAAIDQGFTENFAPAIEHATSDTDPLRGLVGLMEAALSLAASERNILAAAADLGVLTTEDSNPFTETLTALTFRARDSGQLRADIVPSDTIRCVVMVIATQSTMPPSDESWRRYLALVLDGLTRTAASPLPNATPITDLR